MQCFKKYEKISLINIEKKQAKKQGNRKTGPVGTLRLRQYCS